MTRAWNWETGEGLLGMDDPAEVDAALDRNDDRLGAAVIGLALNCPPEVVAPRIIRALELLLPGRGRDFPFTAIAHLARLDGRLTPELYEALRAEGLGGAADHAIDDTLTFVPFRDLPPWLKRRWVYGRVRRMLLWWWLRPLEAVGEAWRALRGHRRP
ncbi:hypothetical protein ACIGMX_41310 [Streptomyces aquilus]|uniref:Uncharacterized protein n=1 Tax=Streptomyces aquilus TaxID=2548456 RepID=A0A3S9I5W8_9ACTN|nr:hypothetical protein [Streptomyces aquilus]AZP19652.1 hypothetical protein EJC51_28440 [Streptomyces aquilus]